MKKRMHSLMSFVVAAAVFAGIFCIGGALPALVTKAETPEYYVMDSCDTSTNFTAWQRDDAEKMQGKASLRSSGNGAISASNSISYKLDAPENLRTWYLEMWLYVDNVNNITLSSSYIELNENSSNYFRFNLNKLNLKSGWNKIKARLSSAAVQNNVADIKQLNRLKLEFKATRQVMLRIDDVCLSKALAATDKTMLKTMLDKAAAMDAATVDGASAEIREAFNAAQTRAQTAYDSEACSQREAEVSAEVLNDAMNAFGFEGFTEDSTSEYGFVDFAGMTYAMMDGFHIDGGELATYGERKTAGFTNQLLFNTSAKYVAEGTRDLRFTFTYFDSEKGGLELHYGSTAGEKTALTVNFAGSSRWKTASVRVKDAEMARSIANYDISFKVIGGTTAYVSNVQVKVITADDLSEQDAPQFAAQTDTNNIIGASSIGYQMWFSAGTSWVHWGEGSHPNPAPGNGNLSFDVYPYIQDYLDNGATLYDSDLGKLGDGSQSKLFSSKDPQIVETHFQWISEYGIDCMAVQRFGFGDNGEKIEDTKNHLLTVKSMAEKYNKAFYVMYDVSGKGNLLSDEFFTRITNDWVQNIEQSGVAASTAYAHADGKPVVCIWGITGNGEDTNYPSGDTASRAVQWFKDRGYYVIIGTPDNGYTDRTGEYLEPFILTDMISPWTVGRYDYNSCIKWLSNNATKDMTFCETYEKDYQPVVFPGFSWAAMKHGGKPNAYPRNSGDFVWRQAKKLKELGAESLYFAMFDEYDEGTAYMKGGTDYFDIPTAQYFVTYAADGQWLSNDYYLRTAGEATRLIKGQVEATDKMTIPYSQGPIYWRNSFEKRWTTYISGSDDEQVTNTILCNIDVCTPMGSVMTNDNTELIRKQYEGKTDYEWVADDKLPGIYGTSLEGTGVFHDATKTTSGEWALQFNGNATASGARMEYLIAGTDIMVSAAGLELTYNLYAVNEGGRNVYVDLRMEDGSMLSAKVTSLSTARGKVGQWVPVKVTLPASLVGRHIKYISISYYGGEGEFNAYIDDVVLQSTGSEKTMLQTAITTATEIPNASAELTKAIADGTATVNTLGVTKKAMLNAMKAIDTVIRDQNLLATAGMLGDVDGDEKITTTDARLTLQFAAQKIDESKLDTAMADVDKDTKVTTTDARMILQYAAQKITSFD